MHRALRPIGMLVVPFLVIAGAAAADEPEPEFEQVEVTLYAEWEGCGADALLYLTTLQPTSLNGCGTIGGAPLNTVNNATGSPALRTFPTQPGDGVPARLDGTEALTGEASVHSWTGGTGAGIGAVIVEATLHGMVGGRMVTFGVAEETFVATPAEDHVTVEFAFDLADHDKEILSGLTLDLNIYGAFADSGIVATGGLTFVNVPTLVEVEEEVEG
jgi:hypothetical protein